MSRLAEHHIGDNPIAYRETSREAWQVAQKPEVRGELDRLILVAIAEAGPGGITCEGIETATGRRHSSVSANLRHLVERGLAKDSGRRTKISTGRNAILWVIAQQPSPPRLLPAVK